MFKGAMLKVKNRQICVFMLFLVSAAWRYTFVQFVVSFQTTSMIVMFVWNIIF